MKKPLLWGLIALLVVVLVGFSIHFKNREDVAEEEVFEEEQVESVITDDSYDEDEDDCDEEFFGFDEEDTDTVTILDDPFEGRDVTIILNGSNWIVGGLIDGQWADSKKVVKLMKRGIKFYLFDEDKPLGQMVSASLHKEGDGVFFVQMADDKFGGIFSFTGNWNPLLRQAEQGTDFLKYEASVREQLDTKGFRDAGVIINEVLYIDLEGDGKKEALILASNITDEDITKLIEDESIDSNGKYSLVILQKVEEDKTVNQIIVDCYNQLNQFTIAFIADVDGDSELEFMVQEEMLGTMSIQGYAMLKNHLYDLNGGRVQQVLTFSDVPQ